MIFQVSVNTLDNLLLAEKLEDDDKTADGVQSVIIGDDRYLRNNDLRLITDKDEYLKTLKKARVNTEVVNKIEPLNRI